MATTKKYTVADGDTLESIASATGTTAADLASLNGIADASTLYTGTEIDVPDAASSLAEAASESLYKSYAGVDTAGLSTSAALAAIEAAMPAYAQSDAVRAAADLLAQYEQNKPADYASTYSDQIAALLDQALNRADFSYDVAQDPLYGIYRDQYARQGKFAMMDTVAEAAGLTGGFANSYAVTAGSQAYQNWLSELNALVPELYQQAYGRWSDEGEALYDKLDALQSLDAGDYEKWSQTLEAYYADLDYYYTRYADMSAAEYDAYQNDLKAWQTDRDYWYGKYADETSASGGSGKSSGKTAAQSQDYTKLAYAGVLKAAKAYASSGKDFSFVKNYLLSQYKSGAITWSEYQSALSAVNAVYTVQNPAQSGGASKAVATTK